MSKYVRIIALFTICIVVTFCLMWSKNVTEVQASSTGYAGRIWKSSVSLKTSKSSSSKTLMRIRKGKKVTVYGTSGKWRKISYKGKTGYALKKYVYISTNAPKIKGKSDLEKGKTIADFARRFKGNRYRYGRKSLNNGTDCSGFVGSVYRAFGYKLPRSSYSMRHVGKRVSSKKMKSGDVIVYYGHVAMYIGGGKIVHASTPSSGIKISRNYRYRRIKSIRRIV